MQNNNTLPGFHIKNKKESDVFKLYPKLFRVIYNSKKISISAQYIGYKLKWF